MNWGPFYEKQIFEKKFQKGTLWGYFFPEKNVPQCRKNKGVDLLRFDVERERERDFVG